jgi:type IV pilus assembly protein PilN
VILINLLPHREAAHKRRRDGFHAALGLAAVLGVLLAGVISLRFQALISHQQDRNAALRSAIAGLDAELKHISALQADIAALRARQQAMEDLQGDRNLPVHLLNELVRQLPDGASLTSIRQDGQTVTLQGMAQSSERVSELLRNLGGGPGLVKPELVEVATGAIALRPGDQRRVASFTMRIGLQRAADVRQPADGPTGPTGPTGETGAKGSVHHGR